MNTRKKFITALILSAFVCIAAVVAARQTQSVKAVRDSERVFGIISLNTGQSLRFNVISVGNPNEGNARRVRLVFDIYALGGPDTIQDQANSDQAVAASSNNLRFLRRESCTASLVPRQGVSCDFTTAADGSFVNVRMIKDEENGPEPHLVPTLEVREGGRTLFIHPGAAKGFNPQPDPPGAQH